MKGIFCTFIIFFLLQATSVYGQEDQIVTIERAFGRNDITTLSNYFSQRVHINLDEYKNNCSSKQTQLILMNFFTKNPSKQNKITPSHRGHSDKSTLYTIFKYIAKTGPYTVFVKMDIVDNSILIKKIEINKQKSY